MNDNDKLIKLLEGIKTDISHLQKSQDTLNTEVSHITTALKIVATKGDVETAVEAAKNEINANSLNLDAKTSRKLQSHERRITNLENDAGIDNPDKN